MHVSIAMSTAVSRATTRATSSAMSRAMSRQACITQRGDAYTMSKIRAMAIPESGAQKGKSACPVSHVAKGADKEGNTHGFEQPIIINLLDRTPGTAR